MCRVPQNGKATEYSDNRSYLHSHLGTHCYKISPDKICHAGNQEIGKTK